MGEEQRTKGRKRRLAVRALLIINFIFILLLLLSYLSPYISPWRAWWMELFALAYGTLLTVNLLFIVLWLILRKSFFLFSLLIVLAGYSRISGIFQVRFNTETSA